MSLQYVRLKVSLFPGLKLFPTNTRRPQDRAGFSLPLASGAEPHTCKPTG